MFLVAVGCPHSFAPKSPFWLRIRLLDGFVREECCALGWTLPILLRVQLICDSMLSGFDQVTLAAFEELF